PAEYPAATCQARAKPDNRSGYQPTRYASPPRRRRAGDPWHPPRTSVHRRAVRPRMSCPVRPPPESTELLPLLVYSLSQQPFQGVADGAHRILGSRTARPRRGSRCRLRGFVQAGHCTIELVTQQFEQTALDRFTHGHAGDVLPLHLVTRITEGT